MKVTRWSESELVVECPAVGMVSGLIFAIVGGIFIVVGVLSGEIVHWFTFVPFGALFAWIGVRLYWLGGSSVLRLDNDAGIGTVTTQRPYGRPSIKTFPLADIDDVMNPRESEGTGVGLLLELADGTVVSVTWPNHYGEEARSVGKQVRMWLKERGYR